MKHQILGKILLTVLLLAPGQIFPQKVSNIQAKQLDDQIVRISYDLQAELSGQLFFVELYSSANDFKLPLLYVEGDVGEDIPGGTNRFIDWDISKELVSFEGDLVFEVRAELSFSPIRLTHPSGGAQRRGTELNISWLGSNPKEYVDIELFRNGSKIRTIARTPNDGKLDWEIPMDAAPGQGYSVKISSTSSTQFHQGESFAIKRKVPLLVKIIPLAAVIPVVIILTDDGGSSGPRILPAPPDQPD